jgi:hypothetical protein
MMTMPAAPCELLAAQLGGMFKCSQLEEYTRIRTPFLYPDGDVVDIFLAKTENGPAITDLGESMRWLRSQTVALKRSPKQRLLIQDVCMTHAVQLMSGMLVAYVNKDTDFADVSMRVAQAAVRVADVSFTMRTRLSLSAMDEVDDYLRERNILFEKAIPVQGQSGRIWTIDFAIPANDQVSYVKVLSAGSRASSKSVVNETVTAWYDLRGVRSTHLYHKNVRKVALFDDTSDVWEPSDFEMVGSLSDGVAKWSNPDEFERIVGTAAA